MWSYVHWPLRSTNIDLLPPAGCVQSEQQLPITSLVDKLLVYIL